MLFNATAAEELADAETGLLTVSQLFRFVQDFALGCDACQFR